MFGGNECGARGYGYDTAGLQRDDELQRDDVSHGEHDRGVREPGSDDVYGTILERHDSVSDVRSVRGWLRDESRDGAAVCVDCVGIHDGG